MARAAVKKRTEAETRVSAHVIAIRRQMKEEEELLQKVESGDQNWASVSDLFEVRRLMAEAVSRISPI